jgi:hypothetical protein
MTSPGNPARGDGYEEYVNRIGELANSRRHKPRVERIKTSNRTFTNISGNAAAFV